MELTTGRFLRLVIILFAAAAVGYLMYSLSEIITVLIISALIAYILDPMASYFERKGLSRSSATSIIFVMIIAVIVITGWLVIPGLAAEMFSIHGNISLSDSDQLATRIEEFITNLFPFIDPSALDLKARITGLIGAAANESLSLLGNMVALISTLAIVPFVVFFLLRDGRGMKKTFISYVPNRYFEMTLNFLHKVDQQLGGYLRGQFIEAAVVGVLSVIALGILQVKYFTVIGIFAGLANLIPYVGPVAGAIPAIVLTLTEGGETATIIYIIAAFALIQFIDNIFVQPMVLSRSVDLHPLVIVLAVLIGAQFFGLLGMVLAVPAAGIVKVTSRELYDGFRKFHIFS